MTDHDISALLSKLDIITQSIKDSDARSANRHMALHHEVTTLSREVRDTQERVSALERARNLLAKEARVQSESVHELVVEQVKQKTALERLDTSRNRVIAFIVLAAPTITRDIILPVLEWFSKSAINVVL